MARCYYHTKIASFILESDSQILGELALHHGFDLNDAQRNAWLQQIALLKVWLAEIDGTIAFEYVIPRIGKRIDCIVLTAGLIFAIEFKVGEQKHQRHAIDQVMDYALDLKNFHENSHDRKIIPILISTAADDPPCQLALFEDGIAHPILTNGQSLAKIISMCCSAWPEPVLNPVEWIASRYKPTPTIIEAAQALYNRYPVAEITRSDAGAHNLLRTAAAISRIIHESRLNSIKSICFLTGVPGAGKTLAGLNLANGWHNVDADEHAVFLSGNGPLVAVLREALARNRVEQATTEGQRISKTEALRQAESFIQNVHHFRDDNLDRDTPPIERVVVFDEAQRAWTREQTAKFMKAKKGHLDFTQSEPEFLISVMDRHKDWATIICLIGGGQEINTGEAGLHEWFESLIRSFPDWQIHISDQLTAFEYTNGRSLYPPEQAYRVHFDDALHLAVSVRSFRSERVSALIKAILDCDADTAKVLCAEVQQTFPIALTRNLATAKAWIKQRARGTERYGVLASSGAMRLKPHGINVKAQIDPAIWFLNDKTDVRSSYFLEDVATEFDVQGLELDWACIAWDADFRFDGTRWLFKSFSGTRWQDIRNPDAQQYLKNTYRVLLTRARQGFVIFIPEGDPFDETRPPEFYDHTYHYLLSVGIPELTLS